MSQDDIGDDFGTMRAGRYKDEEFSGLLDSVKEAMNWLPVLPILKKFEDSRSPQETVRALLDLYAFASEVKGVDAKRTRAYAIGVLAHRTISESKDWQNVLEALFKKEA